MKQKIFIGGIAVVVGLAYVLWPSDNKVVQTTPDVAKANTAMVEVVLPDTLSQNALIGKRAFDVACAACHGTNAAGQDGAAPPLIHKIYEPNHHGDESFKRAADNGVRAHHWPFGDMPPVEGITQGEVTMIIAYIRELQRANGIN